MNINLIPYSKFSDEERKFAISKSTDGYFVLKNGKPVGIAYNDLKYGDRVTTTISHELGHLALGHKQQSELADSEADFFAIYLLTPNPLLEKCNVINHMDVYSKFNVSKSLAYNSWNRYNNWIRNRIRFKKKLTDYEQELVDRINFK
jgi:Zn-dependent peptidase ImmA (M78 family)